MLNALLIMLNSGGWGENAPIKDICEMTGFLIIPGALIFGLIRSRRARAGGAA